MGLRFKKKKTTGILLKEPFKEIVVGVKRKSWFAFRPTVRQVLGSKCKRCPQQSLDKKAKQYNLLKKQVAAFKSCILLVALRQRLHMTSLNPKHETSMWNFVSELAGEGHGFEPFIFEKWQPHVTLTYERFMTFKLTRHQTDWAETLHRWPKNVPVTRTLQVRSRPAGRNGQCQVKQLSAVIWKRSLWAVNTVVNSRSVCAALPRHIIVSSRRRTVDLRRTRLSGRIKRGPTEREKLTLD